MRRTEMNRETINALWKCCLIKGTKHHDHYKFANLIEERLCGDKNPVATCIELDDAPLNTLLFEWAPGFRRKKGMMLYLHPTPIHKDKPEEK
jgi:hypothetical protein